MQNNLRQIQLILYRLKRQYGLPVILRRPTQNENDVTTGKISRTYEEYPVQRCIRLPLDQLRTLMYDRAFVSAGRNFAYGAYFDKFTKFFIVEQRDFTKKLIIDTSWSIVCDGHAYDIADIVLSEDSSSYFIKGITTDSTPIIEPK